MTLDDVRRIILRRLYRPTGPFCGYRSPSPAKGTAIVILPGKTGWDSLYVDERTTYRGPEDMLCAHGVFQRVDRWTKEDARRRGRVGAIYHAPDSAFIVLREDRTIHRGFGPDFPARDRDGTIHPAR